MNLIYGAWIWFMEHGSDFMADESDLRRMNLRFMAHGAKIDQAGPRLGLRKPSHDFHTTHINSDVTLATAILLGDLNPQAGSRSLARRALLEKPLMILEGTPPGVPFL